MWKAAAFESSILFLYPYLISTDVSNQSSRQPPTVCLLYTYVHVQMFCI